MSQPYATTSFTTDTATIAVFDPASLTHRCSEAADWWSIPSAEIAEVNQGNVLFINLGSDGTYELDLYHGLGVSQCTEPFLAATLKVVSGCIYAGAAENVPGGDFGPETIYGGLLACVARGTLQVRAYRARNKRLIIEYEATKEEAKNTFTELLRL